MEDVRRYVSIAWICFTAIFGWLLMRTFSWILEGFGPAADPALFAGISASSIAAVVIALGTAIYCWRHEGIYGFATEVAVELSRVTWPTSDETRSATITVIAFAAALGGSLALMDLAAGKGVMKFIFSTFTG